MNRQSNASSSKIPASVRKPPLPGSPGFTLVELMVTLVVALVFLSLAIPSMGWFVNNNRVAGLANDFTGVQTSCFMLMYGVLAGCMILMHYAIKRDEFRQRLAQAQADEFLSL